MTKTTLFTREEADECLEDDLNSFIKQFKMTQICQSEIRWKRAFIKYLEKSIKRARKRDKQEGNFV